MSSRAAQITALAAALALAIFAVACGDDGDPDEPSGEPLTKEEFITQADAICEEGDGQIEEQALDLGVEADPNELVTEVIVPGSREEVEQLRELVPPEADQAEIEEFLNTFDRGLDELEADPSILARPETIIEARDMAKDYGFTSCNTGGTASAQPSGVSVGGGPKGEFIAEADKICADTGREIQKTIQELLGGSQPTEDDLDEIAEITASGIEDQVSGIRGLEVPPGDEAAVNQILDAAESGAEGIRNDPDSLQSGDVPNEDLQEANDLAVEYGLTVCGS